ncbi:hypothetical protein Tco_1514936 [Tanacetum coccineum]
MEGWKLKFLKNKSFANIQELFDKAMKRKAGDELEQENAKKQKVYEDKETVEIQSLIEVVYDDEEEVAIDVIPLATKPPTISSGPTDNVADEAVNEEMDDTNEIASLKRRVKKLESRNKSRTHGLKRLYKVGLTAKVESSGDEEDLGEEDASKQGRRINVIDADEHITLVNDQDDTDMFGVNDLDGDEVIVDNVDVVRTVEETVNATAITTTTTTNVEITLAQAQAKLKSVKPKAVKDKGKGIMIEEPVVEQVKPMKRLEQIMLDKELAFKLQAEEEEEESLAREKAHQTEEANIA